MKRTPFTIGLAISTPVLVAALVSMGSVTFDVLRGQVGPTNGLLARWTFDSGTVNGTIVSDQSGNGRNGTLQSGLAVVNGCPEFDGIDDRVDIPNFDRQVFTYTVWQKKTGTVSYLHGLIGSQQNGGWGIGFGDYANNMLSGQSGPRPVFLNRLGTGPTQTTNATVASDEWHHIAVTYDGTNVSFYIDGVLDSTKPYNATFNSNGSIYHLGYRDAGSPASNARFKGQMDDVRIYDRVLTEQEITQVVAVQPTCAGTTGGVGGTGGAGLCSSADKYRYHMTVYSSGTWGAGHTIIGGPITCASYHLGGSWAFLQEKCLIRNGATCQAVACLYRMPTTETYTYAITGRGSATQAVSCNDLTPGPGYQLKMANCTSGLSTGGCAQQTCFWEKATTGVGAEEVILLNEGTGQGEQISGCNTTPPAGYTLQGHVGIVGEPAGYHSSDLCLYAKTASCVVASQCEDGLDNDSDSRIDMADPGCAYPEDTDETDLPKDPSICSLPGCGDNVISSTEQCDDGNVNSGDGCSNGCLIEKGWECVPICSTICGDGLVKGAEQCDDGNLINGDGCSALCKRDLQC